MADRSHQQLERATVADGALVGSGRVGGDGVPGGEVGEFDGGGEGGGDDRVVELVRSRDVRCYWRQSGQPGWDEDNVVAGVSLPENMRWDSPMPREEGLIAQMEREVTEAGLGGWFNGNPEDVPES